MKTLSMTNQVFTTTLLKKSEGNEADVVYDNMVAKFQVTVTKTVGEKENLLVAAVLLPLDTEFNNSYIPSKTSYTANTTDTTKVSHLNHQWFRRHHQHRLLHQ